MASDTARWNAPKGRTSRPDAERALIDAAITLVDSIPISDITIHQLAHEAGVNFGYINRYFGSRLNLFAEVTDALADQGISGLRATATVTSSIEQNGAKDFADKDLELIRQAILPLGIKRLKIVQFLISSGVPDERFVKKSQEVLEAAIEITVNAGLDPAIARARIIHGIAMMWGAATLGPVLGLSVQELTESYSTFFIDLSKNK